MRGFIIKYMNKEYRAGSDDSIVPIASFLVPDENKFVIAGFGFIHSYQKIREGIEFEVEVAEFEHATDKITKETAFDDIDPEYTKMVNQRDSNWEWDLKLKQFREIESILLEEGLL